jgi:hypothetical protein
MSVRKRSWTTRKGENKEAWVVNYTDQQGRRVLRTFARKKTPTYLRQPAASRCARARMLPTAPA